PAVPPPAAPPCAGAPNAAATASTLILTAKLFLLSISAPFGLQREFLEKAMQAPGRKLYFCDKTMSNARNVPVECWRRAPRRPQVSGAREKTRCRRMRRPTLNEHRVNFSSGTDFHVNVLSGNS